MVGGVGAHLTGLTRHYEQTVHPNRLQPCPVGQKLIHRLRRKALTPLGAADPGLNPDLGTRVGALNGGYPPANATVQVFYRKWISCIILAGTRPAFVVAKLHPPDIPVPCNLSHHRSAVIDVRRNP